MAVLMELSRILIRDNSQLHIIELREAKGDRKFPINIGIYEAAAIERRLSDRKVERPQTHELLASVIEKLGGAVEHILVNDLVQNETGGTFFARLYIRQNDQLIGIDSRPSDAIALGIGLDVPIYVEEDVLDKVDQDI